MNIKSNMQTYADLCGRFTTPYSIYNTYLTYKKVVSKGPQRSSGSAFKFYYSILSYLLILLCCNDQIKSNIDKKEVNKW